MLRLLLGFLTLAFCLEAAPAVAWGVPTFEAIGIYYNSPQARESCTVRYRALGDAAWRDGYPPVYDAREKQYRGSLVGLKADTAYEIELRAGADKAAFQTRTRSEVFPIGAVTEVEGHSDQTLFVREGGTEKGWRLVTPPKGRKFTSDVFNQADYNIVVEADYVILRGLELRNAAIHGVQIKAGVKHVVIEDCHITLWGRVGGARVWGVVGGSDSAVNADKGAGQLVLQRNLIEYPRGAANDWESGHPSGPQAISLRDSSGGNIIRYNTIRSTEDHGFNDGIGGGSNSLASGYKSHRCNCLEIRPDFSWDSSAWKGCKMGTCSNKERLSTCRISWRLALSASRFFNMAIRT